MYPTGLTTKLNWIIYNRHIFEGQCLYFRTQNISIQSVSHFSLWKENYIGKLITRSLQNEKYVTPVQNQRVEILTTYKTFESYTSGDLKTLISLYRKYLTNMSKANLRTTVENYCVCLISILTFFDDDVNGFNVVTLIRLLDLENYEKDHYYNETSLPNEGFDPCYYGYSLKLLGELVLYLKTNETELTNVAVTCNLTLKEFYLMQFLQTFLTKRYSGFLFIKGGNIISFCYIKNDLKEIVNLFIASNLNRYAELDRSSEFYSNEHREIVQSFKCYLNNFYSGKIFQNLHKCILYDICELLLNLRPPNEKQFKIIHLIFLPTFFDENSYIERKIIDLKVSHAKFHKIFQLGVWKFIDFLIIYNMVKGLSFDLEDVLSDIAVNHAISIDFIPFNKYMKCCFS